MKCSVWTSLFSLILVTSLQAETCYVATDGSDENPGGETNPYRTIQKASDLARAGDTIFVRGGIYRENVILRFSGRPGGPIVLRNYPGEKPVIQPGEKGKKPPGHGVLLQAQEGYQKPIGWIIIEGLEIRYGWDGIKIYNAHDIVIRNCNIHESYNQGILGNGNRVLIDRNIIAGNGTNKDTAQNLIHGIYATGSSFTITNNLIHSNTAYGIQVAAYDYKEGSMAGPEFADAKNWLISNNVLALNKNRAGIVIWQDGVENCIIQNNIFYRNGGVNGILFYSQQGQRHPIRNNIFYPPGENLVSSEKDSYEATGNQQVDPRFVDTDSFDFHLKASSPGVDAGSSDRAPEIDFEGKPRPQGANIDIGAYEFCSYAGPLRIHPSNPRYFTDGTKSAVGSLKAIYLTGSHHWNNLQDSAKLGQPIKERFDYDKYLRLLERYNHNYIRMWSWEVGENDVYYDPAPWIRTGPGNASDGKLRFDLEKFNPQYFERLRSRVMAARDRGIYVGVMLFQGWSIYSHGYGNPWPVHPFNEANNVNGINGDPNKGDEGKEVHTLDVPAVTRLQEAYVRKVIDSLNDLDNVLYEITNETAIFSREWQYHIIKYIKDYEATKPKQHPVGITAFDSGREGSMKALFGSPADWISPQNDGVSGDYRNDPPAADGSKVIVSDTDHLWGVGGDRSWIWKSFTRGHHPIYMDPLRKEDRFSISEAQMDGARRAMGQTRRFAERMNLDRMVPHGELSSTGYCLAEPSKQYLVYLPEGGEVIVDLMTNSASFEVEWIHPVDGTVTPGESLMAGGKQTFKSPLSGDVALYIHKKRK